MGIQTAEEVVEMGPEGNGHSSRPIFAAGPPRPRFAPESKAAPTAEVPKKLGQPLTHLGAKPNGAPAPGSATRQAPVQPAAPPPATDAQTGHYNYLRALTGLIALSRHSEANVMTFLRAARKCEESLASLAEVADKQPGIVVWAHDNWKSVERELTRLKQDKKL